MRTKWSALSIMKLLKVQRDDFCLNPREEFDNLGTMVCWHRNYKLGDPHDFKSPSEFLQEVGDIAVMLPLYLYDHSGITISTSSFSCLWDSGQVGWIYVTKSRLREEFGVRQVTREIIEKAEQILKQEVAIYDCYFRGEVYGFAAFEVADGEVEMLDSCYGFYGDNPVGNGMIEYVPQEFRPLLTKIGRIHAGMVLTETGDVLEASEIAEYLVTRNLLPVSLFNNMRFVQALMAV